jgi:hypothetical protein
MFNSHRMTGEAENGAINHLDLHCGTHVACSEALFPSKACWHAYMDGMLVVCCPTKMAPAS